MLNNRQQSGRRRGRGGQRQQGTGGRGPEQGNRIDNRARGNAPQMLEKYKTLARDAQLAGDRVMTEYYHQFADHYFRVVAETRARYEEQRRQRGEWQDDEDEGEGYERAASEDRDDGEEGDAPREDYRRREPQQRDDRQRDYQGREGQQRDNRNNGESQYRDGQGRDSQNRDRQPREFRNRDDADRGPRRNGRDDRPDDRNGRRNGAFREEGEPQPSTIDVAVLPPAFGGDGPMTASVADLPMGVEGDRDEAVVAEAPKRRGRPRKAPVADAG